MLTLICGLPNAGKTTYSKRYLSVIHFDNITYKSADDHFQRCNSIAAEMEGDVCVEGVYNTRKRRQQLLEAVRPKQDKCVCVWVDTPKWTCIARENRGRSPSLVISQAKDFEPPTPDEGWDEIIIVRNENEQ